jgi:hypothetical protein
MEKNPGADDRPSGRLRLKLRVMEDQAAPEARENPDSLAGDRTIVLGIPLWLYEHLFRFMQEQGLNTIAELVVHVLAGSWGAYPRSGDSHYSDQELRVIRGLLQTNRHSVGSLLGPGKITCPGAPKKAPSAALGKRQERSEGKS